MAAKKSTPRTPVGHFLSAPEKSKVPRLVILGRGQLATRKLYALRMRESVIERLRACAAGPDYLLVEVAISKMCDDLESRTDVQMIPAEELG